MDDFLHMFLSIQPKISVSSFMGYLKEKSVLMRFDNHAIIFGYLQFCEVFYQLYLYQRLMNCT